MATGENPYDQIREQIRSKIRALEEAIAFIDRVEALAKSSDATPAEPWRSALATPMSAWQPPTIRPSGGTWAEAINAVLVRSGRPMLVEEIVKELELAGRKFPESTPGAVIVRSTIWRCKKDYGWLGDGKKPQHWRSKECRL